MGLYNVDKEYGIDAMSPEWGRLRNALADQPTEELRADIESGDEKYGFAYEAPLRVRLRLAWRLVKGESVAYRVGVHGTGIYVPTGPGAVVGCEIRPEGFAAREFLDDKEEKDG